MKATDHESIIAQRAPPRERFTTVIGGRGVSGCDGLHCERANSAWREWR